MIRLSVVVVTLNEESNIEECLRSASFADEIVILDSGSSDRTVDLAKRFTDKVFQTDFNGYGRLKREAVEKASGVWVLSLDADERVSPELAAEIMAAVKGDGDFAGFLIPRKTYFLGRWMMHGGWYPGWVLRLFRRELGNFNEALVHERVEVRGRVGRFKSELLHYSDLDLRHYLWKMDRFTQLSARALYDRGRRTRSVDLLFRPCFTFLKMYIFNLGFLDGMNGLVLSLLSSFHVLLKYVKLWEMHRAGLARG